MVRSVVASALLLIAFAACANAPTAPRRALVIVDIQNDFCPGGSLAVKDGDQIIPIVNRIQPKFDLVVATQDWHPATHSSFKSNNPNGPWPDHCIQGSTGAELVKDLDTSKIDRVFQKGLDVAVDSYSGFFDNDHKTSTGLGDYLKSQNVDEVWVVGLATDYCVKFTALDAVKLGFDTVLVRDATKGVEVHPGDVEKAIAEMAAAKVRVVDSSSVDGR